MLGNLEFEKSKEITDKIFYSMMNICEKYNLDDKETLTILIMFIKKLLPAVLSYFASINDSFEFLDLIYNSVKEDIITNKTKFEAPETVQ